MVRGFARGEGGVGTSRYKCECKFKYNWSMGVIHCTSIEKPTAASPLHGILLCG